MCPNAGWLSRTKPRRELWMFTKSTASTLRKEKELIQQKMQESRPNKHLAPFTMSQCRKSVWVFCNSEHPGTLILKTRSTERFARRSASSTYHLAASNLALPECMGIWGQQIALFLLQTEVHRDDVELQTRRNHLMFKVLVKVTAPAKAGKEVHKDQ